MQEFKVQGMTCGHCVRAVTQAVQDQDPAAQVRVDLSQGQVSVHSDLPRERVAQLIESEGYTVAP